MLAKKYRLNDARIFKKVEASGTIFQSRDFGIAYINRSDDNPSRFAFIISNKVAHDAVDRNTVRRYMSETVRTMIPDIKNGLDVVFLAKTGIIRIPADEIVREVRQALRESGIARKI